MDNFDTFYEEFSLADTPEEKSELLDNFLALNELPAEDVVELKAQITDVREGMALEEDAIINFEIEDGEYKLYTCVDTLVTDNFIYQSGSNYYVKVDDPRDFYKSTGIGETNAVIQSMIDSIKPIYYVVTDDGIGTLKRKNIFPENVDFLKYFTKFA